MLKPNFFPFIFGLLTQIFYSANLELTHENWAHKCPYSTQWARVGNIPKLRSLFAGTDPGLGPGPLAQFFLFLYLFFIYIYIYLCVVGPFQNLFFFFFKFQLMAPAPDKRSLSSNQDINQFLVYAEIKPQISYTTIRDFTN